MKGVIVKAGEPKSIVLFNNGKIAAIPTPVNCHEGMVITVKYGNLFRIIIITIAAVFLIAFGIFIGVRFGGGKADIPQSSDTMPRYDMPRHDMPGQMHRHMMEQRR